jgi:hypothetical protein
VCSSTTTKELAKLSLEIKNNNAKDIILKINHFELNNLDIKTEAGIIKKGIIVTKFLV